MVNDLLTAPLPSGPAVQAKPVAPITDSSRDARPAAEILIEVAAFWEGTTRRVIAVRILLAALERFDGATWQQRWDEAERLRPTDRWAVRLGDPFADLTVDQQRSLPPTALSALVALDVLRPSYRDLYTERIDYAVIRRHRGSLLDEHADVLRLSQVPSATVAAGLRLLSRVLAHTGLPETQVTTAHLHEAAAAAPDQRAARGPAVAWELLRAIGALEANAPSYRQHIQSDRRQSVEEIVAFYDVQPAEVRDLFSRYLMQRATSLDYVSLKGLAYELLRNFWADIREHHPKQRNLHVGFADGRGWLARFRAGPLVDKHRTLFAIRALYNDIAAWATNDPYWAGWAAPCFLSKSDTSGAMKHKRRTQARTHQRIRLLAPAIPALLASIERDRDRQRALLQIATATTPGDTFQHDGHHYRRPALLKGRNPDKVRLDDLDTHRRIDQTYTEDIAFLGWAAANVLHETGIRIEELLELTSTAITTYTSARTGERLLLLQIVPSKSDTERMLVISPELAHVLAALRQRSRGDQQHVPLATRYDPYERVLSEPLPFLFQARRGVDRRVITAGTIANALRRALALAGLKNDDGTEPTLTPHDFRRVFATNALSAGLPVHILARVLGHENISTTQGYTAVYDEDIHRHFRSFLDRRRKLRPAEDYRDPSPEELEEFHAHFGLRKLELGTCSRAYNTPCIHEHACIRCPMLRPDPAQRSRLEQIVTDLHERLDTARDRAWLGEIEGIEISLNAAQDKLATMQRTVNLATPTLRIRDHSPQGN